MLFRSFAREEWEARPFRPVRNDDDYWFSLDQINAGVGVVRVRAPELFLAVRHQGAGRDRGHTWTHQGNGERLETHIARRPLYRGGPEALLPDWALAFYRELRRDLPSSGGYDRISDLWRSRDVIAGPLRRAARKHVLRRRTLLDGLSTDNAC